MNSRCKDVPSIFSMVKLLRVEEMSFGAFGYPSSVSFKRHSASCLHHILVSGSNGVPTTLVISFLSSATVIELFMKSFLICTGQAFL